MLNRVGDKWSIYIVGYLRDGPLRFNELRRSIEGISQRMLTLTLRGLERDGLVTRTIFPTIPPRVDYELTDLGRTLLEPVLAISQWASGNARRPGLATALRPRPRRRGRGGLDVAARNDARPDAQSGAISGAH